MKALLITIDGPSGAGKSTVSRRLAERLGCIYVDTGALYRAVAWVALARKCGGDDDGKLAEICKDLVLKFGTGRTGPRLYANGDDVTDRIRTPEITMLASAISARPVVRAFLLDVQRDMAKEGGVVFEGRDMGTVVFPEADIKFYLDARPEIRAERRYRELVAENRPVTLSDVLGAMKRRDKDDSNRALAPLKPADDAVLVDSTGMGIEDVIETMLKHISPPDSSGLSA
ncbi:MAG: (d)CMP kinase [Deltaproteobacteria bacterium]|nr:(d)CMP kinase [Deltaproteobacteria bacterium]